MYCLTQTKRSPGRPSKYEGVVSRFQVPLSESQAGKLEEIASDRQLSKAETANKIFQVGLQAIKDGWELPT